MSEEHSSDKENNSSFFAKYKFPALIILGLIVLAGAFYAYKYLPKQEPVPFNFTQTQRITAGSPLLFSFAQKMDQASVEKNLFVPEGLTGQIKWEGTDMTYIPSEKLVAGASYSFFVSKEALKATGAPLGRDMEFKFLVAGIPTLVALIPEKEAVEVPTEAKITLIFDRPMIPLTQVQGKTSEKRLENWPVTIPPAIPGHWRWL